MGASGVNRGYFIISMTLLSVSIIGSYLVGLNSSLEPTREKPLESLSPPANEDNQPLDYRVWRVFSEDRRGFTTVVVSVNPKHFNREDMTKLAMQLNREFAAKPKLKVGLLDDANIAQLFSTGRAEYSTYETAERGRYYLDRNICREYVQFSKKRGKAKETVMLKCSR